MATTSGDEPWTSVRPAVAPLLRAVTAELADQMVAEIQARVPEYSRPADDMYIKVLHLGVAEALRRFVDRIERPRQPWDPEVFRAIGRGEAAEGRDLEPFQTAMRLGARVAWRRLTEQAEQLGLDPPTLYDLGEAIFVFLDQLADAATDGYNEARAGAAGEMERRRRRLLDLLLSRPPASPEAIAGLAKAAGWRLPRTVAGVALAERDDYRAPSLPPDVLAGLDHGDPCLLVPDPAGPGRVRAVEAALRGFRAALGPPVPLASAATSLRWAREALALAARGVLDDRRGVLRCTDHMATLIVFRDEELVAVLAESRLAPLAHLRPAQRDRLAETLLAWLRCGRAAGEVAAQLHVHPQTVRYRLRQLEELYGDQLDDPDARFELEIVLRARQARGGPAARD
ncbi:Fis family transcriptional regulator [Sphaerisporangium rufum]|uniref:Fis family transcriptional regulator n=1 Tax=Sphaerisporangium rufum TaxID=1381558 RepID=A0A919R6Z4_9ACTN|nr:helix-turn-helix domain-containing protein [Sphaerisporangium rufum]GII79561.1 Fis family transcriptional regulator [Sphaerisporangium rufum]